MSAASFCHSCPRVISEGALLRAGISSYSFGLLETAFFRFRFWFFLFGFFFFDLPSLKNNLNVAIISSVAPHSIAQFLGMLPIWHFFWRQKKFFIFVCIKNNKHSCIHLPVSYKVNENFISFRYRGHLTSLHCLSPSPFQSRFYQHGSNKCFRF